MQAQPCSVVMRLQSNKFVAFLWLNYAYGVLINMSTYTVKEVISSFTLDEYRTWGNSCIRKTLMIDDAKIDENMITNQAKFDTTLCLPSMVEDKSHLNCALDHACSTTLLALHVIVRQCCPAHHRYLFDRIMHCNTAQDTDQRPSFVDDTSLR